MKISQNGINLITSFEGCKLTAYWDKYGKVWTIGYGHTGPDTFQGKTITQQEAENLLRNDLNRFESYVNNKSFVPHQLNQNQFDALVSFSYNCGQGNLKKLCNGKTLSQIANDLPLYNRSKGKVLPGLTRRRQEEKKLFLKGNYSAPAPPKKYEPKKVDIILNTKIGEFTVHSTSLLEQTPFGSHFLLGDYNHNGILDLYYVKTCCPEYVEVHVLSGSKDYKEWLLHTPTPIKEDDADWDYCLGDYNHDGNLDLFCIKKNKTDSKSTEVHILSGSNDFKTFLLQTKTAHHETDDNYKICTGDFNNDGNLDLFFIKKNKTGSKSTEVHILSGSNKYQSFLLNTGTILHETNDDWEFGVSNYVGEGNKDIYCIFKRNDNEKCTEVHILKGSTNYQSWAIETTTQLHETDENFAFYPVDKQLFIISMKGGSGSTEIHALRV